MRTRDVVEALELVLDENDLTPFQRKRLKEKLRKSAKRGDLKDLGLGPEWAWRICAANLCLGRINHWWGWETRSEPIWDLCNHPWQFPRWDGTPCDLYVVAEQGIGDEIFFSQGFSKLLKINPSTRIECDSRLIPAFQRTFGDYFESRWKGPVSLPRNEDARPLNEPRGPYDAFIPCGNVIKLFVKKKTDFLQNWIQMDPEKTAKWKSWLSQFPKPWVGVSWKGRQGTLDPEVFPEGSFNLNYEGSEGFIKPSFEDFDDMWHFISALDRVDSVTNTTIHMAGSIGVPVNAIKAPKQYGAINNMLQWQFGKLSPYFYPLMRVFQSERDYVKAKEAQDLAGFGSDREGGRFSFQDPSKRPPQNTPSEVVCPNPM